ncbi:hypothetical protein [Spiroplasma chrysopicola]|uniref:Uncharacterized protein n=1 Tax=Spiroplasma chrysopicola DF-1 TaxID=1276227 RepID=R4UH34_9MOLU|nr:hypothetical protein [Spiroplasma chrysopicola]AGM25485.1 hypothetical protein SCHRY_v1c09120 [Spiroplasma chrysopicola DF-1]
MKNKILRCHIPYDNGENPATSKNDNKPRRLLIYEDTSKFLVCFNITKLTQNNMYKLIQYKNMLKISKIKNPSLLKCDSILKLNKIFVIEKFDGIEKSLFSNVELAISDLIRIEERVKEIYKSDLDQEIVKISKKVFQFLNNDLYEV